MRWIVVGVAVLTLVGCSNKTDTTVATFNLSSPDFTNGGQLAPAQRSGAGGDVSPQLRWFGYPVTTQSFAVTMYDRNAKFWHWGVVGIPNTTSLLAAGLPLLPPGASQLKNSTGRIGYKGAAPPPGSGVHHYEVTVYALDTVKLDVASASDVPDAVKGHVLGKAQIVATAES